MDVSGCHLRCVSRSCSRTRESTQVTPRRVCSETPPTPQQWASPLRLAGHLKNGFTLLPVRTEITAGPGVTASSVLTETRQKTYFLIWDMNNQFLTNISGFFKLSFQ